MNLGYDVDTTVSVRAVDAAGNVDTTPAEYTIRIPPGSAELPPPANATWKSTFATMDFSEWRWWGQGQPNMWPQDSPIRVVDASQAPAGASDGVAVFTVSPSDLAAGRIHAKLYKEFPWSSASGLYEARLYYQPSASFASCLSGAWQTGGMSNIFQFKDHFGSGGSSDPTVWTDARCHSNGIGYDILAINGRAGSWQRYVQLPENRWFTLAARLEVGQGITWYIDGQQVATSPASEASPWHSDSVGNTFGIGNYGGGFGSVVYADWAAKGP